VGPASGAVVQIAGDVGQGRVIGGEAPDARVQGGGHDGQRSALAASGDGEVGAVVLRVAGEEIIGADAAEIDAAVVVAVAVVEAEAVVPGEGSGAEGVVDGLLHGDCDAVYSDLEGDDAARGHLDETAAGSNAGAGHAEQGGVFAGCLRLAEHAVEARRRVAGADVLEVDLKAVDCCRAVAGERGESRVDGQFGEGGFAGGPELFEVGGILLGGLDGLGCEGGGGESSVCLPVLLDDGDTAEEARFVHGAAVDCEAVSCERGGLIDFGQHRLRADSVRHFDAGERVSVLHGGDVETNGLAGLVAPVGVLGGNANLNGSDALLGKQGEACHTDAAPNGGLSLQHYDSGEANPALAVVCDTASNKGAIQLTWSPTAQKDRTFSVSADGGPSIAYELQLATEKMGNSMGFVEGPASVMLRGPLPEQSLAIPGLLPGETVVFPIGELYAAHRGAYVSVYFGADVAGEGRSA